MQLKDLHQSHRDLPDLYPTCKNCTLGFKIIITIIREQTLLLFFAGSCLILKPKVYFHVKPHPYSQSAMSSYPSIPWQPHISAPSQWSALCPSLLSFRPCPNKTSSVFGIKAAQLLQLPLALRTVHLLWRLQQLKVPSPCTANRLWSCRGKERTGWGKWANLALTPFSQGG